MLAQSMDGPERDVYDIDCLLRSVLNVAAVQSTRILTCLLVKK